jgi:hypothetical protein
MICSAKIDLLELVGDNLDHAGVSDSDTADRSLNCPFVLLSSVLVHMSLLRSATAETCTPIFTVQDGGLFVYDA